MKIDTTETTHLFGWQDTFAESAGIIRARLFGEMVKRAAPVVANYHSDLYHDVHWLDEHVNGPTEFDFLVRENGTNISESARIGVEIGAGPGYVLYHVALTVERGQWSATFTVLDADR